VSEDSAPKKLRPVNMSSSSDDSSIRSSSFVPTSNEPPQREVETQQKKRSAFKKSSAELKKQLFASMTSPLRSKIACVTPPQDQDETSEAVDKDLSAPSTTLSLIDTNNTKATCSVRDIRYKSIHDMGKSCSQYLLGSFLWEHLVFHFSRLSHRNLGYTRCLVEIIARAPNESQFNKAGQLQLFWMENDMEDERFEYPGFKVGRRLVKHDAAFRFKPAEDLRIGTIIQAKDKKVELRYGDNDAKFRVSVADKFLVEPGQSVTLINRSKSTPCILVLVTIFASPLLKPSKKIKIGEKDVCSNDSGSDPTLFNGNGEKLHRDVVMLAFVSAAIDLRFFRLFSSTVVVAYGNAESKPFETCMILPSLLGQQIQGTPA